MTLDSTIARSLERLTHLSVDDLLILLGVVFALSTLVRPVLVALRVAAASWRTRATYTATTLDDRASGALLTLCTGLLTTLDFVLAVIPQLRAGLVHLRELRTEASAIVRQAYSSHEDDPPTSGSTAARRFSLVPVALLGLLVLGGCANPAQSARTTILALDSIVDRVDAQVAPRYAEAHTRAFEAATSRAEYEVSMQRWNAVSTAITDTQRALLTAADIVEAIDAGARGDITSSLSCVVTSLQTLLEALVEGGVDAPATLRTALGLARSFARGSCTQVTL